VIGCADLSGQGLVRGALEAAGHATLRLGSASAVHAALAENALDALVLEAPGLDPEVRELLRAARAHALPLLLVARDARVAVAVEALRLGASDYLAAPFELDSLQRALERLQGARFGAEPLPDDVPFVTRDPETLALLELLRGVAPSDATVLIEGESGTGKELLARLVHRSSPRRERELVSINCAALPAGLLESELFGHERGAFTGALARSIGKFELAHGATLLLDEIGELELGLQAKLLRVLQEKEVQRVGARRPVPVDFRLVATTNRRLRDEVQSGRFREDLFYRLCVLPIRLRPLRERPCDVLPLAEHFLRRHARAGRLLPVLPPAARAALEQHAWPGTARELENLIERLVLTRPGQLVPPAALDIPGSPAAQAAGAASAPAADLPPFRTLREMERWLIAQTLRRTLGNRTQSARELGIGLRTLRNKIREFRIDEPDTLPRSGLGRFEPVPAGAAHPPRREAAPAAEGVRERTWHVGCSAGPKTPREV
jgi:two-component system response regulator FlrC